MASDRARDTYNDPRQYRRVVHQQGRVVLEADLNEAQQIFSEAARRQTLDVIGVYGVPRGPTGDHCSDGYHVHDPDPATGDFQIGTGSLFLGGWSIQQNDKHLSYANQSDWFDGPDPPLADLKGALPAKEIVYLRLREQEVSAVEDPTLLEPALGGPDTAQRVRLVRRVGRATATRSGLAALEEVPWGSGISVNPSQSTLDRSARLAVGFDPVTKAYAGPENQMIRVQGALLAGDAAAAATQLVWAFNDASALYGAQLVNPSDLTTLTLLSIPVDVNHRPRVGQYAELLLAAVGLGSDAYVAASAGVLLQVSKPYDPTTQTIGLAANLPPPYASATPLFVRIWENSIDVNTAFGATAPLVDSTGNATGLQVALTDTSSKTAAVVPGDYWAFAVRPAVPTAVYPARYASPQPPEGPREWVCPLALIDWSSECVTDTRPSFGTLTTLSRSGGCCTLTLCPQDLRDRCFQDWLDDLAETRDCVTICLRAGCYDLDSTVYLRKQHSNITIEACGGIAELRASETAKDNFHHGLVHVHEASNVKLRGLRFSLPEGAFSDAVPVDFMEHDPGNHPRFNRIIRKFRSTRLSVGLRLGHCAGLTVENCHFMFQPRQGRRDSMIVCGGGIVGTGDVSGITVQDCSFLANERPRSDETHLLFGYIQAPAAGNIRTLLAGAVSEEPTEVFRQAAHEKHPAFLSEASMLGNTFDGLTAASLVLGHVGHLRVSQNRTRACYGGFWIFGQNRGPFELEGTRHNARTLATLPRDPRVFWALALLRCLLPPSEPEKREVRSPGFALHFLDNSVDAVSVALAAWHAGAEDGGSAIVAANRLTSTLPDMPTGALVDLRNASVSGNILVNRVNERSALAFVVGYGRGPCFFAASANAHEGRLLLPPEQTP